ncbi:head maturation protease, ClpP-related [Paenibacillus polymyxa]|uniref:ATP-dependent Clp protease proteolytic subunit n=1 Tax=Paenibacillus polymyxa TaxID=1406 RepID=A0A378XTU3_PAEPO|nr:head maturation protease, ClpP-related [Paenibacillus polymyxa]MBG9766204.1 phage related protease [Paenibacillus polymyxa]SUA67473.1 ATP-dependent Clp protease proteolytic subunit ClpP [Paenibacillus polymyxa]
MKKFWNFKNEGNRPSLYIYGVIESMDWWGDEVTPNQFKADLDQLGDVPELDVYINSDGGDVFAGQAIHSMLKRHKAHVNVYIDGLAASIASVIAMAGDTVYMPRNAMMMIHNPWTFSAGNAAQLRKTADDLDNIRKSLIAAYIDKSGIDETRLIELLDAETWLSADEAISYGLADEIDQGKEIAASLNAGVLNVNGQDMNLSKYKNAPKIFVVTAAAQPPASDPKPEPPRRTRSSLSLYEKILSTNERMSK